MLLISFGTRPEWIKIKPVVDAIEGKVPFKILFTGQHTSLVEEYLKDTFVVNEIGSGDNRLDSIVCSLLNKDKLFEGVSHVMVHGDTTSAFAVGLAAFHRNIPVIHLEAGLRTFDIDNPYPEEFNRTALSALASIHFCPTQTSLENICNITGKLAHNARAYLTGNTVLDNLIGLTPVVENKVLVTMHRRENHKRIKEWFRTINDLAIENPDLEFVLPLHPNPNVSKYRFQLKNVTVVDPLSYGDCLDFIRTCKVIITDSGGIQEESSFLKKKCIVCRKTSERAEGVGTFAFMCPHPNMLKPAFDGIIESGEFIVDEDCPYGDGKASERIVKVLYNEICSNRR
jgi:UDP-N-acetylglucosamine 2-epimerase (non-hydrolysing)